MKTKVFALLLVPMALSLSACGETWSQRAATGAGIGAGTGLAIAAVAGWPLVGPALVGAALGGGIGAATTPGGVK
jgi:osmotically inducible lipoprotein OsmB